MTDNPDTGSNGGSEAVVEEKEYSIHGTTARVTVEDEGDGDLDDEERRKLAVSLLGDIVLDQDDFQRVSLGLLGHEDLDYKERERIAIALLGNGNLDDEERWLDDEERRSLASTLLDEGTLDSKEQERIVKALRKEMMPDPPKEEFHHPVPTRGNRII